MPRAAGAGQAAELDQALIDRVVASAEGLTRLLPQEAKARALRSADVRQFFVQLALGLPAAAPEDEASKARLERTLLFKRRLIETAGGVLTADEVRKRLGHKSVQAVYKAVKERRLLAVEDQGRQLFPAVQFDGDVVRPTVARVLAAAPRTSSWGVLQFLVDGDSRLDGRPALDLLRSGRAEDTALLEKAARTLDG